MANCNYKVHMKDIQNKYKFKIFCTGNGTLTDYYTKEETNTLLANKEDTSNKVISISSSSTDTQYPSAKAVYDSQDAQDTQISNLQEENDYLQSIINQMPKVTGEGTNITLDNTLEAKLDIQLKGNTSQYTTTGKNIFDKSNPIIINGYIRDNQPTVVVNSNNSNRIVAVQCKANTTYTVQKTGGNRFSLITYNSLISENGEYVVTNFVRGTTDGSPEPASQTISTGNDTYLYVHLFDNVNNVNLQEILATIQIEEGSSATSYEEYTGGQASPNPDYPQEIEVVTGLNEIEVCGKNLFDENNQQQVVINNVTGTKRYGIIVNAPNKKVSISGNFVADITYRLITNNVYSNYSSILQNTTIDVAEKICIYVGGAGVKLSDQVKNLQIEISDTPTPYEAYKGATYEIDLRTSKNIFDITKILKNKDLKKDTGQLRDATGWYASDWIAIKPNTAYTSSNISSDTKCWYDRNKVFISYVNATTATSPANAKYLRVNGTLASIESNPNLMIEEGDSQTTYEPYTSIELCKIGTYQDRIYKNNGNWYLHKEGGKVVLDGSNDENLDTLETTKGIELRYYNSLIRLNSSQKNLMPIYSDKFIQTTPEYLWNNVLNGIAVANTSNRIILKITDTSINTLELFKTWLSSNNVTIYYILSTPTDTQITDTTLISQLNALEKALAYQNQTNISQTNADKPFIIDASTIYDLSNLVTRVAVLETE